MKKRITAFIVAAVMALSTVVVYANDASANLLEQYSKYIVIPEKDADMSLTVEEAFSKAKTYSVTLRKQSNQIKLNELTMDVTYDGYTLSDATSTKASDVSSALINYTNAVENKEIAEKQLELSIIQTFYDIITDKRDIAYKEMALKTTEKELSTTRMKAKMNMITEKELEDAELNYNSAKSAIETAKSNLQKKYDNLSIVIGETTGKVYDLILDAEYETLDLGRSYSSYITTAVAQSTELKQLEREEYLNKLKLDTFTISGDGLTDVTNYQTNINNVNNASLTRKEKENSLTSSMQNNYNNIVSLEESYNQLIKKYELAEKELEITKQKYDSGMVTELEYKKAIDNMASIENEIISTAYEHMVSVYMFSDVDLQ